MTPRTPAILCVLSLLAGGDTHAQTALTIEQAVAQALTRAPELAAARHAEDAAAARVGQARTAYWPRAGADVTYSAHWPKTQLPLDLSKVPIPITVGEIDDVHRFRAGAQIALRAFDLSRGDRVDAARSAQVAESARTRETGAALAFQVRATFLAALFARDVRRIAAESLQLAQSEEQRARLRADVGTGSQVALAQARVRVASLRAQQRQAESELERQRRLLQSLLGLPAAPELRGELAALASPVADRPLHDAPSMERLRASRIATELGARATARTILPTLSLLARADLEYPHVMKLEWGPLLQAGVTLAWDLYDGGLRGAQVREAWAQAKSLVELERATADGLRRRLIDLQARGRTAEAELTSAREILQQTEVYLRVARAAALAGTGTALDVHNAELGLDRTRVAVQQALLGKALVRAETLAVHGVIHDRGGDAAGPSGGAR